MNTATYVADNDQLDADLDNEANKFAFRNTLSRFADRTSLVGPPFIISSKHWLVRSIWIVLFCGAIGFTIWQVYSNAVTYLSWPKKTEVTLSYATLPFPMVTICNANPIRRSQLHLASPNLNEFLQSMNPETYKHNESMTPPPVRRRRRKRFLDEYQKEKSFNKTYVPDDIDSFKEDLGGKEHSRSAVVDEFKYLYGKENPNNRKEMGHQLDDMLLSCAFETRECDVSNFTHFTSNKYGNCYAFNAGKTAKSKRWGNENGLSIILFLEVDEYIRGLTLGYGLRVSISDPGKKPFPGMDGVFVSAGRESDIGVRMINVSRMGQPYGECESNNAFQSIYKSDYSRQMCQATCVPRTVIVNCSCYERSELYMYPIDTDDNYPECSSMTQYKCLNKIKSSYLKGTLTCECHSPCNETTYDSQITSREWPTEEYLYALVDAVCRDEIKDGGVVGCNRLIEDDEIHKRRNFLLLNVFYRDLNFEVMTETADYPSDKFLSDLGGSIGLGLGLCILGVAELFHLFFELILYLVYKCHNAGKIKKNRPHHDTEKTSKIHPETGNEHIHPVILYGT